MKSRSEFAKKDKNHESFGRNDRDTASSSAAGVPLLTLEVGTSRFRSRNLRLSSSARRSLSSYVHRVEGLPPGVYRYWPEHAELEKIKKEINV